MEGIFMRKKGLLILPLLILALLTGCKSIKDAVSAKTHDLGKPFSCSFKLSAYESDKASRMALGGTMHRLGTGIWEMDITDSETLNGLHISYNDAGLSASLGNLNFDIERDNINGAAMFKLIFDAVENCSAMPSLTLTQSEDGSQYSGQISQCGYIMTFSPDTMELIGISFPDAEIEVTITDFRSSTESGAETTESGAESEVSEEAEAAAE